MYLYSKWLTECCLLGEQFGTIRIVLNKQKERVLSIKKQNHLKVVLLFYC
jgi:hypothetical protein